MSEIRRLLSRKDGLKWPRDKSRSAEQPSQLLGLLNGDEGKDRPKIPGREIEKKVKEVKDRLLRSGIRTYEESDISFVLKSSYIRGDTKKAFESLILINESVEGVIRPYNPRISLLGAVNWNGVSCYLDSILFAMFARLDSFEAMLYKSFNDPKQDRLATLIRVWVNTVRAGKLAEADVVKQLQESLAKCGWPEAADFEQQDASEAFSFITEKLDLPMLTLKMDLFHTGKEDVNDDHRFVRERLLEVAIPEDRPEGSTITLEDCLETYFNSRVEVKRYLGRRTTMNSFFARQQSWDSNKLGPLHIESVEVAEPGPSAPATGAPPALPAYSPVRPGPQPLRQSQRQPSIIQETLVWDKEKDENAALKPDTQVQQGNHHSRQRAMSIRKEVMMPAWQFFSLIPWYTDVSPQSDAQVAAHFSSKRPVLGICLKRYLFTPTGEAIKRTTHIDIPIEIGLPHFIHDDTMSDNAAAFGNFKLSLQSVVCHRGVSVYSGHYVSLVRGSWSNGEDKWMLFDDLTNPRIKAVEIDRALKEESPYLLFYQIQPIEGKPGDVSRNERPPSYLSEAKDSAIGDMSAAVSFADRRRSSDVDPGTTGGRPSLEEADSARRTGRTSTSRDRGERRLSIAFTNTSTASLAKTDDTNNSLSVGAGITRRDSRRSRRSAHSRTQSRATSQNGGGDISGSKRLSSTIQRFAGKISPLTAGVGGKASESAIVDEPVPLPPQPEQSAYTENRELLAVGMGPEMADPGKGRLRKEIRDKSVGREKSKLKKEERPDRECVIM